MPVAEVVASDPDGAVSGEPVLVSRYVPGVLVSRALPVLDGREAASSPPPSCPHSYGAASTPRATAATAGTGWLDMAERAGLLRLAERMAPRLAPVRGARQLVPADYNPKNLLARRRASGWAVAAVLDWEFACSSSPLFDVGNMLRHRRDLPPSYVDGFVAGYRAGGGLLPAHWREISEALDLFALADLLTRPPGEVLRGALAVIRERLG